MLFERLILRRTPFEYNEYKTLLEFLYYYMRNLRYLIGLEQWYFSFI